MIVFRANVNSYKGKLDNKQIANGINAARHNARRLFKDAQLLLKACRYPSAASLAILSIEESGKEHIIRGMSIAETDAEIAQYWQFYRTHTKKNIMWLLPQLVMQGARNLDEFRSLFEPTAKHPYILEKIKQIGFYTDCLGKIHWSKPAEVIDKDLAEMLVQTAKLFLRKGKIKAQEIEIWAKHLGPVKNDNFLKQKEATLHWYAEIQELGLSSGGKDLRDFLEYLDLKIDK